MPDRVPAPRPAADAVCDGGDLDCGSGLLLIIRSALQPLPPGGVLEVRSRESSVKEDLPAWCRMVGHALLATAEEPERATSYFLRKKGDDDAFAGDLARAREFTWKVRTRWTGGMRAMAFARNHSWPIGQPASFDTEDAAPSAIEHLLGALAGCLAVGFQWRASKAGIEVEDLEVTLSARSKDILVFLGVEADGSPALEKIEGKLFVRSNGDRTRLAELWEETVRRSPVAQTLAGGVEIGIEFRSV
jgi:uncharacterized OsmC-like protein/TusA-related sulfurtransferase